MRYFYIQVYNINHTDVRYLLYGCVGYVYRLDKYTNIIIRTIMLTLLQRDDVLYIIIIIFGYCSEYLRLQFNNNNNETLYHFVIVV